MRNFRNPLFSAAVALIFLSPCVAAGGGPVGTWYLDANHERLTIRIAADPRTGSWTGSLINESGATDPLDQIRWDGRAQRLEFRRKGSGRGEWFRGRVVEGVFAGRFARSTDSAARPVPLASYTYHVTGWNADYFDRELTPRVYEVLVNNAARARLRIGAPADRSGAFTGRFKVYSTLSDGAAGEELEYDVEIVRWDGTNLQFVQRTPGGARTFFGTVTGRTISGTFSEEGRPESLPWSGTRAELLSYGIDARKTPVERAAWQQRTRRQLRLLLMAGNPAPLSRKVTILRAKLPPLVSSRLPAERDDDPAAWPQNYRLTELQFDYTLPNPYGGAPIARRAHAYLAAALSAPPGARLPAVLALNGHGGSAWKMTNPDDVHYWFGDAFARRGYLVLALDVSHRPEDDRRAPYLTTALYGGALDGDDPAHGNGAHPAIKATGFDSDWEEDGERAWDAMRALDYLLSLPNVDASRIVVTGLSMGGTVSALVAALDPRVTLSLPSAPSADLGVMLYKGNHSCWRWLHGDVREYLDSSDLFALTAPRPLIVMTGKSDGTYSLLPQPFAGDKQILRRARAAYAEDSSRLVHYLHYDGHRFHVGEKNPTHPAEEGVRTPDVTAPESPWSLAWQTDAQTSRKWPSLFDCIAELLRRK